MHPRRTHCIVATEDNMWIQKRAHLVTLALVLPICACVTTTATRLGLSPVRPPVPEAAVAIYRTASQVPGRYEEVAILTATGDYAATDEEKMFRSIRRKAALVGANGVILESVQEPGTGGKSPRGFSASVGSERARPSRSLCFRQTRPLGDEASANASCRAWRICTRGVDSICPDSCGYSRIARPNATKHQALNPQFGRGVQVEKQVLAA